MIAGEAQGLTDTLFAARSDQRYAIPDVQGEGRQVNMGNDVVFTR